MNEEKWKFTLDKLIPIEKIISDIEKYGYIDAYLGYEDDFQIDSILYYLKTYQQLQNNWNELKKWLEERKETLSWRDKELLLSFNDKKIKCIEEVLNKMQELEQVK